MNLRIWKWFSSRTIHSRHHWSFISLLDLHWHSTHLVSTCHWTHLHWLLLSMGRCSCRRNNLVLRSWWLNICNILIGLFVRLILIFLHLLVTAMVEAAEATSKNYDSNDSPWCTRCSFWTLIDRVLIIAVVTIIEVIAVPVVVNYQESCRVITCRIVVVSWLVVSVERGVCLSCSYVEISIRITCWILVCAISLGWIRWLIPTAWWFVTARRWLVATATATVTSASTSTPF